MTAQLKLRRDGIAAELWGHSRGHWEMADHPLSVHRHLGRWVVGPTMDLDSPEMGVLFGWLDRAGFKDAGFERRGDALAAVQTALAVCPPPWNARA